MHYVRIHGYFVIGVGDNMSLNKLNWLSVGVVLLVIVLL
ncbi:hypothetical protein JCM19232_5541 [Vibrio ishigakensis]|uniref:Uncharacterized protein n=1 Tax=Vibrio ishigakensis TaxID=1481914 RepID=A0A0B8NZK1_9VIBR|nr:hypothetical protein JCM19231_3299 [Vibrio ishigakensis]GAM61240.1 hypothetical protein JCM19232_5541 [Vibrio ishigakensis]